MRPHPRKTETDPFSPRAWATCDRCGFVSNLYKLSWQYDWRGAKLDNVRILVCEECYDDPQRQLGFVFIPPDPLPEINARVELYALDEQPISTRYTMNGLIRIAMQERMGRQAMRIVNQGPDLDAQSLSLITEEVELILTDETGTIGLTDETGKILLEPG
jgi:hypothetical protein